MRYIILAKSIGLIFIIVGTYIATTKLRSIDRRIQTENESIEKFEDQRILAGISMLKASHIANLKRLYLMEANIAMYSGEKRERAVELRKKALNQDATEIRNWNALFSKGETSELFQNAEEEVKKIATNTQLTIEQKLEKVENILVNARDEANERLRIAHQKRNEHKNKKGEFKKTHLLWNNAFMWLQILGLTLLAGSEIIEKLIIKNS